jgi:hypothetical protein
MEDEQARLASDSGIWSLVMLLGYRNTSLYEQL